MNLVYDCRTNGWVTEKECSECFKKHANKKYSVVKHCRRDNVIETEKDEGY